MIRIALADDHKVFREGLREILKACPDFEIVGEAGDGLQVLQLVRKREIDVLVLDLSMPGRSGIELLKLIRAECPRLHILVLSMHAEHQYAVRAIRAGAAAYMTKESPARDVIDAIRRLAAGGVYIHNVVAELLAREVRPASERPLHEALSDREYQVFRMLVAGEPVGRIGARLHLSIKTISTHKSHVMEKLNCATLADLVRYALVNDLVPSEVGGA